MSLPIQLLAWLTGLGVCLNGLYYSVQGWSYPSVDIASLILLAVVPICWGWRRPPRKAGPEPETPISGRRHGVAVTVLMACSLGMSLWTAYRIGTDLPPIYHDEYSYLFQAKTYLSGRTWFPSHPTHPGLFDQMHVLNDNGRMASRYFPGTGLWMAPFVAIGHPYWGHWLCGMLTAALAYAVGCELGNARAGWIAGLLTALSPGLAFFSNLLLAHHPTLLGLSFFLWRVSRLQRTHAGRDALLAGIGLAWAMLCRPMTAAGFGLPFGIWTAWWLLRGTAPARQKQAVMLGFAAPIALGLALQLADNASITGSPWTSPYQLYTDIYTPRHVYGFNNVVRGEQRLGPKTLDQYDRWAENLDGRLAVKKVAERLVFSLMWTWDVVPMAMLGVILFGTVRTWEWRQQLPAWAIVSLHLVHIPYWFSGIMGWHYVLESALLWTVACGLLIDRLLTEWSTSRRPLMPAWLMALAILIFLGNWSDVPDLWMCKVSREAPNFRAPRRTLKEFRDWTQATAGDEPSLVLVAPHQREPHLDFVVNDPGLSGPLLYGRLVPGKTDVQEVARDFPGRAVFLCEPDKHQIRRIVRDSGEAVPE